MSDEQNQSEAAARDGAGSELTRLLGGAEREKCPTCGGDKAVACEAIAGVAGYHVKDSRRVFCPVCDTPPTTMALHACDRAVVLVPDAPPSK